MNRLSPRAWIRTLKAERRAHGWKGMIRRQGWKPVVVFFLFYLIRDLILYVLLPLGLYFGLTK